MMKKLKLIIFSLLLALWWLPMSHNALAVPLEANELSSAENASAIVSQEHSVKNEAAFLEGALAQIEDTMRAKQKHPPNFCFEVGMVGLPIPIRVGDGEVEWNVYARAYSERGSDKVRRQYLAIYYPDEYTLWNGPVSEDISPRCTDPIRALETRHLEEGSAEVELSWRTPKEVFVKGQKGILKCENELGCGGNTYYYYAE